MSRDLLLYADKLWEVDKHFLYTGEPESFTLEAGSYLFECVGAKGGHIYYSEDNPDFERTEYNTAKSAGKAIGVINLSEQTTFYAVVGGDGQSVPWDVEGDASRDQVPGGYNGGGDGSSLITPSGGGASDIRLNIQAEDVTATVQKTLPAKYNALKSLHIDQFAIGGILFDTGYVPNTLTGIELDCALYSGESFGTIDYDTINYYWHEVRQQQEGPDVEIDHYYFMAYSSYGQTGQSSGFSYFMLPSWYQTHLNSAVPKTEAAWSNTLQPRIRTTITDNAVQYNYADDYTEVLAGTHVCSGAIHNWPTMGLFGYHYKYSNTLSSYAYCQMDFYSFTIKEDLTDVHKYIPVVDTDTDKTGLYDLCTAEFHEFDIPDYNSMPMGVNVETTVNGITFKSENGRYYINGTFEESTDVEFVFNLRESYSIPKSYQNGGTYSLKFMNDSPISADTTIEFRSNDTVVMSYTGSLLMTYHYDDTYNAYDQPINNIRIVLPYTPNKNYSDMFAFMFTELYHDNGSIPGYQKPGRFDNTDILSTHTFTVNRPQRNSINSRIIVAAGNAGCNMIGGSSVGSAIRNSFIHNGMYTNQQSGGLFGKAMPYVSTVRINGNQYDGFDPPYWYNNNNGGAGGGWYGGLCGIQYNQDQKPYTINGSGSSYVLTEESYKPDGYMEGYNISKYYMEYPFTTPMSNEVAHVKVYKEVTDIEKGDIITAFCNGRSEKVTLEPGIYHLTCNGASGGQRERVSGLDPETALGGHVTGTWINYQTRSIYATVGGSAYDMYRVAGINKAYSNAMFPLVSTNGGGIAIGASYDNKSLAMNAGGATDFRTLIPHTIIEEFSLDDDKFVELEWIENTADSFFRTGVYLTNDMDVEMDCVPYDPQWSQWEILFGCRNGGSSAPDFELFIRASYNYQYTFQVGLQANTIPGIYNQRVTFKSDGSALHVIQNGEVINTVTAPGARANCTTELGIYRLVQTSSGSSDPAKARIYSFKVFNNKTNKMLYWFVPCKTKNVAYYTLEDMTLENGNLPSGDSSTRVRTANFLEWNIRSLPKWINVVAEDVDGNPLQFDVLTYDSSGYRIDDIYWINSGTDVSISDGSAKIKLVVRYPNESGNITPADIGRLEIHFIDGEFGLYDIVNKSFLPNRSKYYAYNTTQRLIGGDPVPEGTVHTNEAMVDIDTTMLSRFLVAGGSGGMGRTTSPGGAGGGESGTAPIIPSSTYGDNYGPGTQTAAGTGSRTDISGGFGYGGSGVIRSSGYGGAGGGGWYGGSGTYPDGTDDDDKGGAGGSGYVLTADSYKPTGYLCDESYYMSEPTSNITGGSNCVRGFETAIIEVTDLIYYKFIIRDEESLKYYDSSNNEWIPIPDETEVTDELIETFGSYILPTESGIVGEYDIYVKDTDGLFERVDITGIPDLITISTTITSPNGFDTMDVDIEDFEHATYDYTINNISDKKHTAIINISMMDDEISPKIYSFGLTSTQNFEFKSRETKEKKYLPHIDLMKVGESTRLPQAYNDYIMPTLSDGTIINSIEYVEIIEKDRVIHVLMSINNTTLRYSTFNLYTKAITTLFEIPLTSIGMSSGLSIGHFIFNEDNVYVTSNAKTSTTLVIINVHNPSKIIFGELLGYIGDTECGGSLCWVDEYTIALPRYRAIVYFDIRYNETKKIHDVYVIDKYSMAYNRKWILTTCRTSNTIVTFNKETLVADKITGYNSAESCICHGGDKFYLLQYNSGGSDVIVVYDDNDLTKLATVSIPMSKIVPISIMYANGILYMTFRNKTQIYMCILNPDYTIKTFKSTAISNPITDTLIRYDMGAIGCAVYPLAFKQYIFTPYFKLSTINYPSDAKYNLGYKYNRSIYPLNDGTASSFVYDPRFVTFTPTNATVHSGVLHYPITETSGDIKTVHIDRAYNKFISASLIRKEEEDDDE